MNRALCIHSVLIVFVKRHAGTPPIAEKRGWQIGESFDQQASGRSNGVTELRCMVTCPDCGESINVTAASAKKNLSLTARQHQKRCARSTTAACVALPASKRPRTEAPRDPPPAVGELQEKLTDTDVQIVTIYSITYKPTGLCVYTGKTKDPEHRLSGHASRGSKCRLIRNAIRKHGIKNFSLDPIIRCRAADADANESHWIIKNNTLYPAGYNLRHGSMAGWSCISSNRVTIILQLFYNLVWRPQRVTQRSVCT